MMTDRYRWMLCSAALVLCSLNMALGQYDNSTIALFEEESTVERTSAVVAPPRVQPVRPVEHVQRVAELLISGVRASSGPWQVEVLNEAGQVVRTHTLACTGSVSYRVDDLRPGRYVARVGNGYGATVVRFAR